MVKKKTSKKKVTKKKSVKKVSHKAKEPKIPTLKLKTDHEIALDFATKTYKKFTKVIKSIVLFGSVEEQRVKAGSDIDIIIIIDDVSLEWSQELIAWYRQELEEIIQSNPYEGKLHINTIKLSTWWDDLLKGDPVILNIIRSGFVLIDHAGFIEPLKYLMAKGKIKGTPEAVYQCLQRAPNHIARSRAAELTAIDGLYWSIVDSAHGALIAAHFFPASPYHVASDLKEAFVARGLLKEKYVEWYKQIYALHKKIDHGEIKNIQRCRDDKWQERAEEFMEVMIKLTQKLIDSNKN